MVAAGTRPQEPAVLRSLLSGLLTALTARPGPIPAGPGPAHAATDMAVQDDNDVSAERIPAATGITPADRTDALQSSPG